MQTRARRPTRRPHQHARWLPAIAALVVILAGCGPGTGATSPGASPGGSLPAATPDAATPDPVVSAVPSTAGASAEPEPTPAGGGTQTETEWGRIWDDLPGGFPIFPGGTIADDASPDPVTASYAYASGDRDEIAAWMQAALESATYSTEALSGPMEDGSVIIDSVGDGECRLQTVIAPMGGLTMLTVRYGAACPNR